MMHDHAVRTRQTQINIESWHLGHQHMLRPAVAGLCRCSWTWLKECLGFVLWSLGTGCFPPVA